MIAITFDFWSVLAFINLVVGLLILTGFWWKQRTIKPEQAITFGFNIVLAAYVLYATISVSF